MRLLIRILLLIGVALLPVSAYCHIYESSHTGLLPVISYPLRSYALPMLFASLLLLLSGAVIHRFDGEEKSED